MYKPDGCFLLLANSVHPRNCLQLKSRVQQRLAEEYMARVNEVQPARMGTCVQEEDFGSRVVSEARNAMRLLERRITNPVAPKSER